MAVATRKPPRIRLTLREVTVLSVMSVFLGSIDPIFSFGFCVSAQIHGALLTEDRCLSIYKKCKHLGVSSDTVYKWIEQRSMPAHRMGRLWKHKKTEVDRWIKAGGAAEPSELVEKRKEQ